MNEKILQWWETDLSNKIKIKPLKWMKNNDKPNEIYAFGWNGDNTIYTITLCEDGSYNADSNNLRINSEGVDLECAKDMCMSEHILTVMEKINELIEIL